MMNKKPTLLLVAGALLCMAFLPRALGASAEPRSVSGVYPHLTMYNTENECGTGAVVPWAGKLWAITYAPHQPKGSSDKLYEITDNLQMTIRPESIGGTPANRMIHKESNQLFVGPYAISATGEVRAIPYAKMPGRHTGNARHLVDPAGKIYYATMEEGLYSVDVETLAVEEHIKDGNGQPAVGSGAKSQLHGYHGKGLYSGQERVVYSNNGQHGKAAKTNPTTVSGALAQWFGADDWQMVRKNQFTEVTGPNGIYGSENPDSDPVWAMGWDARSLLLGLLEGGEWSFYRLPKGSHSYDGAHGWNTEWPRIREIGEKDLLATMHGTFWRFPARFSKANSAGISPRSNYLKVIGDFCKWNDRIVLGCDDSAKAEFLNTRAFKSEHAAPLQSNSNLWFVEPDQLDELGPVIGRGSVWLRDDVAAGGVSDPYLFAGYDHRQLTLTHGEAEAVTFTLEVDRKGNDIWSSLREVTVAGTETIFFSEEDIGAWIRIKSHGAASGVTAHFQYRNADPRVVANSAMFAGVATSQVPADRTGLLRSLAYNKLGVALEDGSTYTVDPAMSIRPVSGKGLSDLNVKELAQPARAVRVDAASVIIEEDWQRYRLPKNAAYTVGEKAGVARPKNLALGAKAKAGSVHADIYAASNVVDGKKTFTSRWISAVDGVNWVEIALGAPKTFQSVVVTTGWKMEAQYAAKHLEVQTQVNGAWTTVSGGSVTDNRSVEVVINLPEAVTAQQVRLRSDDVGVVRIYEFALYEEPVKHAASDADFLRSRVCREVATERDLLNVHGTFYELPARNAQGMAKMRPVATHNLAVHDFCSHNGLLFFTGLDAETTGEHIFRSADGKVALWAGVVDDLWKLGKPRGLGGPWKDTAVKAGVPSDPYIMTAYDRKHVVLSAGDACRIMLEVDLDGTGLWVPYETFSVAAGELQTHTFPEAFSAYWVRAVSDVDTTASVIFTYE